MRTLPRVLQPPLAALLLALLPCAVAAQIQGPAERQRRPADPALRQVAEALGDENLEAARRDLEPLLRTRAEEPVVQLLGGVLRFHEQRYPEAVELLERAGTGELSGIDYLQIARAAREITQAHQKAESEHFAVSTPPGKDQVLVPYLLEALEAQRAALQQDLGWVPPGRVAVEILQGTGELARISTLTDAEIRTSGTIALCKFNKLMIVSPKALVKGYDWLDTAAHEYTHYVVTQRTSNNTPIWLHEGLAKYAETRWRGAGGQSLSPYAAALLQDAARKDKLITFEQMHPSMAKLPSQEAATLAFAEVMVAVEYLYRTGGQPLLSRILDRIAGAIPAERAVAEGLGVDFDRFVADWKKYLVARPLPAGGDVALRRLQFQDDPKAGSHAEWAEIPDEKARQLARLGEILRERGRWAAARIEYGKAIRRVGPGYPLLTSKFALASMLSGRDQEAEQALLEAARTHPHYAALHVNLGRILVKRQDWKGARQAFLLANRVDPFDPEIHAGLAAAAEATGDSAAALRERGFAQLLSERASLRAPAASPVGPGPEPLPGGAPAGSPHGEPNPHGDRRLHDQQSPHGPGHP